MSIDYPVTPIYSSRNTDEAFTLGRAAAIQVGVENLKDGQVYDYTIVSGDKYERGTGVYSDATKTITRTNITSSNNNLPEEFSSGILVNISLNGSPVAESVKVLDFLGAETKEAISQRCVTDELGRRLYNQDPTNTKYQTPAKALFFTANNKVLAESADGSEKTLADETFVAKAIADATGNTDGKAFLTTDLSNIDVGAFKKQALSFDQVVNALNYTPLKDTDLSGYMKADFSNMDAVAFQSLKITDQQVINALGYTPASSIDADGLADNKLINVNADDFKAKVKGVYGDIKVIQTENVAKANLSDDGNSLTVIGTDSKSYTIGGVPDSVAKTDLSNVSSDTFNKKLNYPVSGEDPTIASGGANNNNKGVRNLYVKALVKSSDEGWVDGATFPQYAVFALTNSSYGTEAAAKLQIPTLDQVKALLKSSSASTALIDNLSGNSTTAAPTQNAVVNGFKNYVTGLNGKVKSVSNIYAHATGAGTSVNPYVNITVQYLNDNKQIVSAEMATQSWVNSLFTDIATKLPNNAGGQPQTASISGWNPDSGSQSVQRLVMKYGSFPTNNNLGVRVYYNGSATIDLASLGDVDSKISSVIVQSPGTSTTNILSQKAISDNYAPKAIDDLSGTSTTAPPSQNSVKVAIDALQAKIDDLTKRVAALENK